MRFREEIAELAVINLAEFICESDAIENICDDAEAVMRQIKQRKKNGHVGAMLLLESLAQSLINAGGYINKNLICMIQEMITSEQHLKKGGVRLEPQYVGCYRPKNVRMRVGDRECPPSVVVPEEMSELINKAASWQDGARWFQPDYNLHFVADWHFKFLILHPFADGNGRTARALAYYMMRWAGLKPFIFNSFTKHESYYPCFNDLDDSSLMRRYFREKYQENLDQEK